MSLLKELESRANNCCELCGATENLEAYQVPSSPSEGAATSILACKTCVSDFDAETKDVNHWRCLNDSMWSAVPAVQVMAWRMLNRVQEDWTRDLLDMMYMEEDTRTWAEAAGDGEQKEDAVIHRDVNGVQLQAGDSVVLIKDLKVKGSSMVAKQGTAVRRISLDPENENYIEGKVDGQHIVIITQYVKKL
jgi:protein PhnA